MNVVAWACMAAVVFGSPVETTAAAIDENKLVDLTHVFDENTIHWPTAKPFQWQKDGWSKVNGGYWYASGSFTASDHLGTHIDSPIHFAEGKATTDALLLRQLTGPAVVVDISKRRRRITITNCRRRTF